MTIAKTVLRMSNAAALPVVIAKKGVGADDDSRRLKIGEFHQGKRGGFICCRLSPAKRLGPAEHQAQDCHRKGDGNEDHQDPQEIPSNKAGGLEKIEVFGTLLEVSGECGDATSIPEANGSRSTRSVVKVRAVSARQPPPPSYQREQMSPKSQLSPER